MNGMAEPGCGWCLLVSACLQVDGESEPVLLDQSNFCRAVDCFCEPIEFSIDQSIEDVRDLASVITDLADTHRQLIVSRADKQVISELIDTAKRTLPAAASGVGEAKGAAKEEDHGQQHPLGRAVEEEESADEWSEEVGTATGWGMSV